MVVFDSKSELFRYPQGAIKENDKIKLRIHIKRDFVYLPKVIIEKRNDFDKIFYKSSTFEWVSTEKNYDIYSTEFSIEEYGNYYYSFDFDSENNSINQYNEFHELLIYKDDYNTPQWIKGGIIYHIFVDRFYKNQINTKTDNMVIRNDWGGVPNYKPNEDGKILNNDFFGGNLNGIIHKLPYLSSLGVTVIYLSPIFEAHSNHKYDTSDYLSIDPMFGSENDFVNLCKKAKEYSISIILDGVFNHTGDDSVYFNKYNNYKSIGAYQSKNSPYFDWYTFNNWNDEYNCWWNIKILPTLNKINPNYIDFIMGKDGVLKHWLKQGARGYRLDVADELPNEFLDKLRQSVKSEKNDAVIIGEVWEDASNKFAYDKLKEYFCGNQLDSVTNYPLRTAIIDYLKNKDCTNLYETMNIITEKYPLQSMNCLMNILGTHDTIRILTELGSYTTPNSKDEMAESKLSIEELSTGINLLKIASLLQMTLPGIPCIYYGDEVGIEGWKDPFNRICFPWGHENVEILNHYKFLSKLRKSNPIFIDGNYRCISHDKEVFIYERYKEKEKIVIGVNLSNKEITLSFHETMKNYTSINSEENYIIKEHNYIILCSI
jgi:glycosidase